ncbi:SGNH/GDSL hydrolase family protein [Bacillus solitudinis]|uniref:SGNH/GDSL hydrolase family protein n=1 Tax=Bacillus solitudinis TaxID=2014074 RepID=UPI000C25103E|nr:SGNH/GDSL hydrolase family protein [Bacillus solitudinis]
MKNILSICFLSCCLIFLTFGHFHYKDKLATIAQAAKEEHTALSPTSEPIESISEPEDEVPKELPPSENMEPVSEVTGVLQEWVEKKQDTEAINLSFFGSASLLNEAQPDKNWPSLVTAELKSRLNHQEITATIIDVARNPSSDILYSDHVDTVIESKPDILLVEPFILNDAGVVTIEDSLSNIKQILTTLKKELPETDIIIMPANPLVEADYYVKKTEDLANFAKAEGYDYANHWEAWPSPSEDKKLEKYLDNGRPNSAGHTIWAEYLVNYLTSN